MEPKKCLPSITQPTTQTLQKKFYGQVEAPTEKEAREIIRKENLPNQVNIELTRSKHEDLPGDVSAVKNINVFWLKPDNPDEDKNEVNFGLDDDK
jgi:hypothetical protein